MPVLIHCHGYGEQGGEFLTDPLERAPMRARALAQGWQVVTPAASGPGGWGNDTDLAALHEQLAPLGDEPRVYLGQSMGGLVSLRAFATDPHALGWYGIMPCVSTRGQRRTLYWQLVQDAQPGLPACSDPVRLPPSTWRGKRLCAVASPDDTHVPWRGVRKLLRRAARGGAVEATLIPVAGEHGEPAFYDPEPFGAFLDRV